VKDHDELTLRVEAAMERYEERRLRMKTLKGHKQRLCAVGGCHRRVLITERFCVLHMPGINQLTIREKVKAGPFMIRVQ
jgi:hypothetical protein